MNVLIDRARLMDEEIIGILDRYTIAGDDEDEDEALGRAVAAAQLAKALWAVVDWLAEWSQALPIDGAAWYGARLLAESCKGEVLTAGIPRPTVHEP